MQRAHLRAAKELPPALVAGVEVVVLICHVGCQRVLHVTNLNSGVGLHLVEDLLACYFGDVDATRKESIFGHEATKKGREGAGISIGGSDQLREHSLFHFLEIG